MPMNRRAKAVFPFVILMMGMMLTAPAPRAEEYTYESMYAHYSIVKEGSVVELRHLRKSATWLESAVDLADPPRQVVDYTKVLYAGVFFADAPQQVLMIGLGGGGFNRLFNAAFTTSTLQTVDVDPMALELSKKHMGFTETARNRVTILDGRRYIKKTQEKWDWVILDAFHGGYIPFQLKTREFYQEIKKVLSPRGILISNLHNGTLLYESDVKTLQSCFSQVMLFDVPEKGNVIAIAANYDSPKMLDQLSSYQAGGANAVLRKYLDLAAMQKSILLRPGEKLERGSLLTDDYCPAEYLDTQDVN